MLQAWDFVVARICTEMHDAARQTARTVAVLSRAHQTSVGVCHTGVAGGLGGRSGCGRAERLVVEPGVEDCPREGLLRQVVGVGPSEIDRNSARERLLAQSTATKQPANGLHDLGRTT